MAEKLKALETKYDQQFNNVQEAINYLLQKDSHQLEQENRTPIGFELGKKKK